jgi:hypothetical protein
MLNLFNISYHEAATVPAFASSTAAAWAPVHGCNAERQSA